MKIKNFFKNLFVNIKYGISRFTVAFCCSVLSFLTASFAIISEYYADEIFSPLYMTFAIVSLFSVLLRLISEHISKKIAPAIEYGICAAAGVLAYFLIKPNYPSPYTAMAYSGILASMICFIFYVLMRDKNRDTAFPKIVASFIFSAAIGSVLSGGLSTCIAAFCSLIYSFDNSYKVYSVVNLFVWVVCVANIFLALIPKKDVQAVSSKIFRTFILFALLPLYVLLTAILLIYLGKIVVTWNMPVGEINWFASFASLFFIFILMSTIQYTEKAAKLFVKFGGYFLIPVLIMQSIAVFERINAYGLTTPRTVSLVLIFISILFIAGSVIIPKHLNKIALASGIIVLIVTITPFNVIDMPISSQTNILKSTLLANGMLTNDTVSPKENISDADKAKIISAYEYLKYDAENLPSFIPDNTSDIKQIFGFEKEYPETESKHIYCNFNTKESVDISGYNKMIRAEYYSDYVLKVTHNDTEYEIDLKDAAQKLYKEYGTDQTELDIYVVNENIGIYFNDFSFRVENGELSDYFFNGYVLLK